MGTTLVAIFLADVVVCREELATDPRVTALVAALRGPTAKRMLLEKFAGAALPAQ